MPHCPCLRKFPRAAHQLHARACGIVVLDFAGVIRLPSRFVSSGFGSNRSMWLGPPCMNIEIIAFARGGLRRLLRQEIEVPLLRDLARAKEPLFLEQSCQRDRAHAVRAGEEFATGKKRGMRSAECGRSFHGVVTWLRWSCGRAVRMEATTIAVISSASRINAVSFFSLMSSLFMSKSNQ